MQAASTPGPPPCYVFDSSSLIDLEDARYLEKLPARPGNWIVIPTIVAEEVNQPSSLLANWMAGGRPTSSTPEEDRLSERLLQQVQPKIHIADAQAIAMSYHRKGALVIEDKAARAKAQEQGIRCLHWREFLNEVMPQLLL